MAKTSVTKFRWFWAWQDEKEEAWLGEMSRKGYHLSSVVLPCIYRFTVGEPRNYVYRLDFQPYYKMDPEEYLQLFRDAGWEHIRMVASWQYFRKEARQGETPEIFSDVESKAAKYGRLLAFMAILATSLFVVLILNAGTDRYPFLSGIYIFIAAVFLVLIYAIFRLAQRIRQLKRL